MALCCLRAEDHIETQIVEETHTEGLDRTGVTDSVPGQVHEARVFEVKSGSAPNWTEVPLLCSCTDAELLAEVRKRDLTLVGEPRLENEARASQCSALVFSHIDIGKAVAHLDWIGLTYSVKSNQGRKVILKNMTGSLRPGQLTCILGPSGSGKTTLLNLLAGRQCSGGRFAAKLDGEVRLDGCLIEPYKHQHNFGYVMQENALFPTETPREVIRLSAMLRLPNIKKDELKDLTEDMLKALGLTQCADTMVGNDLIKGISGGQQKRTAIGTELITNPERLFLDEPTSGLDSAAAFSVIQLLKELTKMQQSVMCTIHQPSSEIFQLFDHSIFLADGQVVFDGPPSAIRSHFSKLGFPYGLDHNPADFILFLVQTSGDDNLTKITQAVENTSRLKEATTDTLKMPPPRPKRKGCLVEFNALAARQMRCVMRDKVAIGARFANTAFLSIIVSLIWFRAGITTDEDYDFQSHNGGVTLMGIDSMMGCALPAMLAFPSERPVFLREKAAQMYGIIPYFLSKTLMEMPVLLLQCTLQLCILYWLIGLNGSPIIFILAMFMNGGVAASIALFVGCFMGDVTSAIQVLPMTLVPQILFAGFLIKIASIPVFLRWLQYFCGLKWTMNILLANEFDSSDLGRQMLNDNDVDPDLMGVYFIIQLGLMILFRAGAALALGMKARSVYG